MSSDTAWRKFTKEQRDDMLAEREDLIAELDDAVKEIADLKRHIQKEAIMFKRTVFDKTTSFQCVILALAQEFLSCHFDCIV